MTHWQPCGRALVAGLALLALTPATASPEAAPDRARIKASATDLFNMAESLLKSGQSEQARSLLELLAGDPDLEVRSEALFRQAQLLDAGGRHQAAAVMLRRILDGNPKAAAVRLKLATLLQKMGDEESALRHLRALRSADLPLTVARFVDRLSASLQASKPFGIHLELALAPDSNINRATRSDTLGTVFGDFALDQKAESGVGAAVRGMAQARRPVTANLTLIARASAEANLYRDKEYNDISLDLSAGPEWRIGRTRLTAEGGVGQQWFGMKPYQRNLRLAGSVTQPIGAVSQARIDLSARWTDNRFNDLQDGRGVSARLRYERALSPQMLVSAFAGIDRFKARDDAYSTRSWNAGVTFYREVGRMTLTAGAEFGRLQADDRLALLPEAREDRLTRVHLGAIFRQLTIAGFAPMTRLVIERNRSSVEFYDYKRTRTEFGISRAF